jgi:hypothetical protein
LDHLNLVMTGADVINYGRFHVNYEAQLSCEENEKIFTNYGIINRHIYIYICYDIKITKIMYIKDDNIGP